MHKVVYQQSCLSRRTLYIVLLFPFFSHKLEQLQNLMVFGEHLRYIIQQRMEISLRNNLRLFSQYLDIGCHCDYQYIPPVVLELFVICDLVQQLVESDIVVQGSRAARRFQFEVVECVRDQTLDPFVVQFSLDVQMVAFMCHQHAHVFELLVGFGRNYPLLLQQHRVTFIRLWTGMPIQIQIVFTQEFPSLFILLFNTKVFLFLFLHFRQNFSLHFFSFEVLINGGDRLFIVELVFVHFLCLAWYHNYSGNIQTLNVVTINNSILFVLYLCHVFILIGVFDHRYEGYEHFLLQFYVRFDRLQPFFNQLDIKLLFVLQDGLALHPCLEICPFGVKQNHSSPSIEKRTYIKHQFSHFPIVCIYFHFVFYFLIAFLLLLQIQLLHSTLQTFVAESADEAVIVERGDVEVHVEELGATYLFGGLGQLVILKQQLRELIYLLAFSFELLIVRCIDVVSFYCGSNEKEQLPRLHILLVIFVISDVRSDELFFLVFDLEEVGTSLVRLGLLLTEVVIEYNILLGLLASDCILVAFVLYFATDSVEQGRQARIDLLVDADVLYFTIHDVQKIFHVLVVLSFEDGPVINDEIDFFLEIRAPHCAQKSKVLPDKLLQELLKGINIGLVNKRWTSPKLTKQPFRPIGCKFQLDSLLFVLLGPQISELFL